MTYPYRSTVVLLISFWMLMAVFMMAVQGGASFSSPWGAFTWVEWMLLTPLIVAWVRSVERKTKTRRWHLAGLAAGAAVFPLFHLMLYVSARGVVEGWSTMPALALDRLARHYTFGPIIYGATVLGTYLLQYYWLWQDRQLAATRLQEELSQAELQLLQANLQPRFLLEALDSIGELMAQDPAAAERAIARLSDLLRLLLDRIDQREVLLEEDLHFAEVYIALMNCVRAAPMRLDAELSPQVEELLVPNFLLQQVLHERINLRLDPTLATTIILRTRHHEGLLEVELTHPEPSREGTSQFPVLLEHLRQRYGDSFAFQESTADGISSCRLVLPARTVAPDSEGPQATKELGGEEWAAAVVAGEELR